MKTLALIFMFCLTALLAGCTTAPPPNAPVQQHPEPVLVQPSGDSPEQPITIDFVRKDIHTVMHYIGLRAGLNITVEGDIAEEISYLRARMTLNEIWNTLRRDYGLDVIVNGKFVYIKRSKEDVNEDPWYRAQRRALQNHPMLPVMPRPKPADANYPS